MGNGNGETLGIKIPNSWVEIVKLGLKYGISTVFAVILLLAFLGIIDSPITRTDASVRELKQIVMEHREDADKTRSQLVQWLAYLSAINRQTCVNQAATAVDRRACDPAIPPPTER